MPPIVWPFSIADRYKMLAGDIYVSLRNHLLYRASFWPFDDLTAPFPAENIEDQCRRSAAENWTDAPDHGDFPFFLSLQLVFMAIALFQSISPDGSALRAEIAAREDDLRRLNAHRNVVFGMP
jgi:hypothetical protein